MRERDEWDDDYAEPASGVASRAVTQGFVGTRGAEIGFFGSAGFSEHTCPLGCRDAPWPDCAGCGRPAVVALPDPDPECPHSLSLCAACWGVLLSVRGPQPTNATPYAERKNKRLRFSPEELARIVTMREGEGAMWTEIGRAVGAYPQSCGEAYRRAKARERASGIGEACPPMLECSPVATTDPSPSVVPKTRRRPALPISVPTPTTKRGHARASATPSKSRTQKRTQTREPRPLSAEVEVNEVERPSLMTMTVSKRKCNIPAQERSTGRQHSTTSLAR